MSASSSSPPSDASATSRRWLSPWASAAVMAVVGVYSLAMRFATLQPMELRGDALIKWYFVRTWFRGNEYVDWSHHMTRFGMLIPAWITQLLLGDQPPIYSVAPLLFGTLCLVYTYRLGALIAGPFAGAVAVVGLVELDAMARASSQLLPGGFMATYAVMAAFYVLKAPREDDRRRTFLIVAAAVLMFGAYLTKISALFFLPAFGLIIWQRHRSWRPLLLFFGTLAGLYVVEHIAYLSFTQYPLGRLQIVLGSHDPYGGKDAGQLVDKAVSLARFYGNDDSWQLFIAPFPFVALGLMALTRDIGPRALVFLVVSFQIGQLIGVSRPLGRYLTPMAPFIATAYATFLVEALGSDGLSWGKRAVAVVNRRPEVVILGLLAALLLSTWGQRVTGPKVLARARRHYVLTEKAYDAGTPIVNIAKAGKKRRKTSAILAVSWAYLPRERLPHDHRVHVPRSIGSHPWKAFPHVKVRNRTFLWLSKESATPREMEAIIRSKCFYNVRRRDWALHFDREQLPPGCPVSASR